MKNTLTSVTCINKMTFVLTKTADKKRLLIVMLSDTISFAFGNIGRCWSNKNHGLDRNRFSLKTGLIIN